jgi:hypothetical protein
VRITFLDTPPVPLVVDPDVFDAFAWNESRVLEWRTPRDSVEINPLDPDLPLRMAFVLREPWDAVPTELARLHVGRKPYALGDEAALAPYGIDDATDQLYAAHRDAHATFWLAADNLNALFWALHDWSHFHNHGAFEERTATELQCDTAALVWLWTNRDRVPIADDDFDAVRRQVLAIHDRRVAEAPPRRAFRDEHLRARSAFEHFVDALPRRSRNIPVSNP